MVGVHATSALPRLEETPAQQLTLQLTISHCRPAKRDHRHNIVAAVNAELGPARLGGCSEHRLCDSTLAPRRPHQGSLALLALVCRTRCHRLLAKLRQIAGILRARCIRKPDPTISNGRCKGEVFCRIDRWSRRLRNVACSATRRSNLLAPDRLAATWIADRGLTSH